MTTTPDHLLDRILTNLRDTEAPRGLESRVAARLAQAAEAHAEARRNAPSPLFRAIRSFAVHHTLLVEAPIYAVAAAALLAATLFGFQHHHSQTTTVHTNSQSAPFNGPTASDLRAENPPHHNVGRSPTYGQPTTGGPTARSITPAVIPNPAPTDPDAVAFAETLAPSRPAPPMALTPQEQLLVAATRQGQPIELAELDLLRAPALHSAAEARERSNLRQLVQGFLAPLATAESLSSSPPDPSPAPEN
jgi:hypothetical protein